MSSLSVSSFISSLTIIDGVAWRQADYDASKMKKFIKREEVKGYLDVKISDKWVRYYDKDRDQFLEIVSNIISNRLAAVETSGYYLVPIPNSEATIASQESYKTLDLAHSVAQRLAGKAIVCDALRWRDVVLSSRKGGTRDPQLLYDNLSLVRHPQGRIILLDDVMTTGAHMMACTRKLTDAGFSVSQGLVAVRATWEQKPNVLIWVSEDLEISSAGSDFHRF